MKLIQLKNKHVKQPALVVGTGPSAWAISKIPEYLKLFAKMPVIGVNRAFNVGVPLNYQISLDRIWQALLETKAAMTSYRGLHATFAKWRKKAGTATVLNWTVEDFIAAYRTELSIHPEVMSYFRLCSPYAPFKRLVQALNYPRCPYDAVQFPSIPSNNRPTLNKRDGLWNKGNTSHAAIHLAAYMGCNPIYLIGVDLASPDKKARPWELCIYARAGVIDGFKQLATMGIGIWNLNPKAPLGAFPRVESTQDGINKIKGALKCAG